MKNPNGYGSIDKMSDRKRRNPWRVRVTTGWRWDDEKEVAYQTQKALGYFKTRKDALQHLAVYNADPYSIDAQKTTFKEVFETIWEDAYGSKGASMQQSMKAAFKNCAPLHDIAMGKIKGSDWRKVFSELAGKSKSTINNVKILAAKMYEYCNEEAEMKLRNYAEKMQVETSAPRGKTAFTVEQVQKIWDNIDTLLPNPPRSKKNNLNMPFNDTVIIMIYTGMRISELLEVERSHVQCEPNGKLHIDLHGTKTAAARRSVPIHDKIMPLIEKRLSGQNKYLIADADGKPVSYDVYSKRFFAPMMKHLGINRNIHECRHTFVTFAKRSKMDELARKLIIGHTAEDFTDRVYTHYDLEDLHREMDKLKII